MISDQEMMTLTLQSSSGYIVLGVWRVQIIRVKCSQIKTKLDIEPSQGLVSSLTGNNMQYSVSRKLKKYKDEGLESLELAIVIT